MIPDISSLLDSHLLAKNKAEGDRPVAGGMTWRASKLGSCLRAQYLEFYLKQPKIVPMDALSLRRFEIGHSWGRQFAQWFRDLGYRVSEEIELHDSSLDVGGHADFVISKYDGDKHRPTGVELKSVNSKWFWYRTREKETTASPEHMMQAAVYSLLTANAYPWIVLTVSKDDLTMQQDVVTEQHRQLAIDRIDTLNSAVSFNEIPPCTCLDGWEFKYCSYYEGDVKEARKKGAKPDGKCCEIKS